MKVIDTCIYTGVFTTSPIKSLDVETNNTPLELRRKELGLRLINRQKRNLSYRILDTLNISSKNKKKLEEHIMMTKLKPMLRKNKKKHFLENGN